MSFNLRTTEEAAKNLAKYFKLVKDEKGVEFLCSIHSKPPYHLVNYDEITQFLGPNIKSDRESMGNHFYSIGTANRVWYFAYSEKYVLRGPGKPYGFHHIEMLADISKDRMNMCREWDWTNIVLITTQMYEKIIDIEDKKKEELKEEYYTAAAKFELAQLLKDTLKGHRMYKPGDAALLNMFRD